MSARADRRQEAMARAMAALAEVGDIRWPGGGWLRRRPFTPLHSTPGTQFGGSGAWGGPKGMAIIASIDLTRFGPLLHVSVGYEHRDPSWLEIKTVRSLFFPMNIDCMMMLPAEADYVNVHPHVFHIVQCPERWNMR